jgi:hypothetical protein
VNAIRATILTIAALTAASAPATAAPCPGLAVEVQAAARARWPALGEQIRQEFAGRDDVDPCARVAVTLRGSSALVTVTLSDGRLAGRSASRPDDITPTLAALLLVPQAPAVLPVATSAAAAPGTAAPETLEPVPAARLKADPDGSDRAHVAVARPERPPMGSDPAASPVHLDLSIGMGARVGDGQAGVGLGVISLVEIDAWLVGLQARADSYRGLSPGPTTGALEFAALGGRRLRAGTLVLDFLAGPALGMQVVGKSVKQVGSTEPAMTTSPTIEPRLLVGTRLTFRAQSTVRTFVGLDGDFALTDTTNPSAALPPLPAWTVGLVLGATVGTR